MEWTQEQKEKYNDEQRAEIEKMVQSEADRVRTSYSTKVRALEEEVSKLKPAQKTEAEIKLEQKEKDLWQKEINLTLKENDLDGFGEFVTAKDAEDLKGKMDKLKTVLKDKRIDNSFKPEDHKSTDAFSEAQGKGDALGMVKALFK